MLQFDDFTPDDPCCTLTISRQMPMLQFDIFMAIGSCCDLTISWEAVHPVISRFHGRWPMLQLKSFAEANQRSLSVNMTWLGIEPKTSGVEITKGSPWAYTDHKCYAGLTKGRGFNSPSDNNSIIRRLSRRVLGELQLVDSTFQSKDRRQVQTLQTDWNA